MWELKFLMEWCEQNRAGINGKWVPARPFQLLKWYKQRQRMKIQVIR
jgi:hypothetical protein